MRRWISLLLCLQILSNGQVLSEVVKMANLLDHFIMHKDKGEVSDWAGFLRMHYFDPEHRRSDPGHHERLPLQHATPHAMPLFITADEYPLLASIDPPTSLSPVAIMPAHHPVAASYDIFQPPRTV